jgi:CheY-like chemotaxis protein
MNGVEVLKRVKSDPIHAKIPFVVATGNTDPQIIEALLHLGADICLTKPFEIAHLLVTIQNLLRWHEPV